MKNIFIVISILFTFSIYGCNNVEKLENNVIICEEQEIINLKITKITEDSAKITFETAKESIPYINGQKISEIPLKKHYYYVTNLIEGKENILNLVVDNITKEVSITTKEKGIDYSKNSIYLDNRVFYQIFVRAFADSDGDGIGDFNGITENLDYLEYLGVNGIWLMPINKSKNYHGYDVTNYYELDPSYGTMDDFKKLLAEAEKRDIKIVIDMVLNHCGMRHEYFRTARRGEDSPYRDWFSWSNEKKGLGWEENGADGKYYYAAFWSEMPDFNFNNPLIVSEVKNIMDYWLEIGVDGFRFDAVKHLFEENHEKNKQFWYEMRKSVKNSNENAIMVAENWMESAFVAQYFEEFDMNFNFDLGTMIINTINNGFDCSLVETMKLNYGEFKKYNENFIDAPFITNHDQKRVMSEFLVAKNKMYLERSMKQMKQASVILMTMGGVPFVYYGEEIGQTGKKPDENIREPFDWYKNKDGKYMTSWMKKSTVKEINTIENDGISVEEQKGIDGSLLEHYKKLIHLRKTESLMGNYNINKIDFNNKKLYSYSKDGENSKIIVILNLDKKENIEIDLNEKFQNKKIFDIYNNSVIENKITINSLGFMLLKIKD
ncbi:MAG: alpha-amylase [Fusobacteria bacterium]|nr:alpha-amylase [Fusobacteriota bacterium]